MRNKFLLVMLMVISLGAILPGTSVLAVEDMTPLVDADYITDGSFREACISCGDDPSFQVFNLEEDIKIDSYVKTDILECSRSLTVDGRLASDGAKCKEEASKIILCTRKPFYRRASEYISAEVTISCPEHGIRQESQNLNLSTLGYFKHSKLDLWIHEDVLKLIPDGNRGILSEVNGALKLIVFDPVQIDLYVEGLLVEKEGNVPSVVSEKYQTEKYGIAPLFFDANDKVKWINTGIPPITSRQGTNLTEYITESRVFLVCSNCKECTECKSNLRASNGFTMGTNSDELCLSNGCAQEHACGFFWEISNGSTEIPSTEGADCRTIKAADKMFCDRHTCNSEGCDMAVIGENTLDARSETFSAYQGVGDSYSNYCVTHACWEYLCRNERRTSVETNVDTSDDGQYVIHFPKYCDIHCNDCGIVSGGIRCENGVDAALYKSTGRNICSMHAGKDGENIELLKRTAIKCDMCGKSVLSEYTIKVMEKIVCQACVEKVVAADEESLTWLEFKDKIGISNKQELLALEEFARNPEFFDEKGEFKGFPGNEEVESKYHECNSEHCNGQITLWYTDEKGNLSHCARCGYDEAGEKHPIIEADSDDDPENDDPEDWEPVYGGSDYSYWPDDSGSITTTPDSTQCIHANYPVPNTVTFSNMTATTHIQNWICTNCNAQQSTTYEHTYINGTCVCGEVQDTELPTVELVSPASLEEVEKGAQIMIRAKDNKGLKSVSYSVTWGADREIKTTVCDNKPTMDIEIGALPTETGIYALIITEVVDVSENKLSGTMYTFEIKEAEDTETGDDKDDEENTGDEDGPDAELPVDDDKELPKIGVPSFKYFGKEIQSNNTYIVELDNVNSDKTSLILSDNKGLDYIEYNCLWDEENFVTLPLTGSNYEFDIKNLSREEANQLIISDLVDTAGNRLENILFVFTYPAVEELDTEKPKIELMSPQNLNDVKPGTKIKINFSDNYKLNELEYTVTLAENDSNNMIKGEKIKYPLSGVVSYPLELAILEDNSSIVILELKLTDMAGNVAEAKYTFKMSSNGTVDVKGEGDAGYYLDEMLEDDGKNEVEYDDLESNSPTNNELKDNESNKETEKNVPASDVPYPTNGLELPMATDAIGIRMTLVTPLDGEIVTPDDELKIVVNCYDDGFNLGLVKYSINVKGNRVVDGKEVTLDSAEQCEIIVPEFGRYLVNDGEGDSYCEVWIYAETGSKRGAQGYVKFFSNAGGNTSKVTVRAAEAYNSL